MSTKIIVGIMLLALIAIWFFGSANEIASVCIVLGLAALVYATARRRHTASNRSEESDN